MRNDWLTEVLLDSKAICDRASGYKTARHGKGGVLGLRSDYGRRSARRFHVSGGADNTSDSGWRFFSGEESQDFADDPNNFEIYDVNTIANYDPDIIPLLESPAFSAFEREPKSSAFVRTDFPR
ncbi:DUF2185 domain-containing protein [Frankia sp. RB7]|nr:DUF2185 domain-containing protein [Frankia sp. RB7]